MISKKIKTNQNPQRLWALIKEVVNSNSELASVRGKINWNDSTRQATISYLGAFARISINGNSELVIEVNVSFPASLTINGNELINTIENSLRRYL